jgi:transposase
MQRVNAEYAVRRRQANKAKLRFRVSRGPKRSLGWVPFKAKQLRRHGRVVRFSGKSFRVFERERLDGASLRSGCFAQDAVGDWWLCVAVEQSVSVAAPSKTEVGIDLGLKTTAATSDGEKLEAGRFYTDLECKIAQAQRRSHKWHAKRLCLAQILVSLGRQLFDDLHWRCEQYPADQDADGQVRARCRLGNTQGATTL